MNYILRDSIIQESKVQNSKEDPQLNIQKTKDKLDDEEYDENLLEDNLDLQGTIEKAKVHANAQKLLKSNLEDAKKYVVFCDDCFLPQETEGIVEKYPYCIDPKKLVDCGFGLYFFFVFHKYLIVNLICLLITCSGPYIFLSLYYGDKLNKYCTEFYIESGSINGIETNNIYCPYFIRTEQYKNTSFDLINILSGEVILFYVKILKDFADQKEIDDVIINFNIIFFISSFIIFFIHLMTVCISSILKAEIDNNEQSPADYTLIVSDIPTEKNKAEELKNDYLNIDQVDIKEINLTYKLGEQIKLTNQLRKIQKKIYKANNNFYYNEGILCCKKKKKTSDLIIEKSKIQKRLKNVVESHSDELFNGVAFITFNKQSEAKLYEKLYPSTFLGKVFTNLYNKFTLYCCGCCLSEKRKKILGVKNKISVSFAPEPEDVIFEHLEYHFLSRLFRTFILYFLSILLVGVSFAFVLGINHIQYKREKKSKNSVFLKYFSSILISIIISGINFLIKRVFIKLSDYEKPWTRTDRFLSISTKLTILSFVNSAIVPYVSNRIRYGSNTYQNLVRTISISILIGSIISPLISITCYDLLLKKFFRWFYITRKYKNETEKLPFTQRELNFYFENPIMEVGVQYSNLFKQILMTVFYLPLVPSGPIITLIGVILNYFIEKFKCLKVYRKPFRLNEKIAFFYIDYFVAVIFVGAIGNILFISKIHSDDFYEYFTLIFYGILILIPYNIFIRKFDISGVNSFINQIPYDEAYLTFSFDYERLNPKTQKTGAMNYTDKLVKMNFISEEIGEKVKENIGDINLKSLFYFTQQTENLLIASSNSHAERIKNNQNKKINNVNNFLTNLAIFSINKTKKKKPAFDFSSLIKLDNIKKNNDENYKNLIFTSIYEQMIKKKNIFKHKQEEEIEKEVQNSFKNSEIEISSLDNIN